VTGLLDDAHDVAEVELAQRSDGDREVGQAVSFNAAF